MKRDPRKTCLITGLSIIGVCVVLQGVLTTSGVSVDEYVDDYLRVTNSSSPMRVEEVVKNVEQIEKPIPGIPNPDPSPINPDPSPMPTPVSDHNHVAWKQSRYSEKINSATTIKDAGCGWCSLTAAMAYLNPEQCADMQPSDWLQIIPKSVTKHWSGSMQWTAPKAWVDYVNSLGTYGTYELVTQNLGTGFNNTKHIENCIQYAGDRNTVVLISSSGTKDANKKHNTGLFTGGGHIICCVDTVTEGNDIYLHIADSSGMAAGILGQPWETMSSYNFPAMINGSYVMQLNGWDYKWKCSWVIRRVS